MTSDDLHLIMPHCPTPDAYAPLMTQALVAAGCNTVTRAAAFLGQLAHESGELRWLEETASGAAYEGRRDLGNTEPGDGARYKGRGWIQLTGRDNYRAAGTALGLNLVDCPGQAADPQVAALVAAWYWLGHGCNELADALDLAGVTRAINGGLNGYAQRWDYYVRALEVLGRGAALA
jgi:predicted chitinase